VPNLGEPQIQLKVQRLLMQPYPTRRNEVGKNNALNLTRHSQCTPVEPARA